MRGMAVAVLLAIVPVVEGANGADAWRATPGGWASGDLEYVRTVPFEAGTAIDAVLHETYLYTTTWRSFSIYDVSQPLEPRLVSQTPAPAQLINENPETNGSILLLSNDNVGRTLDVYDVSNKAAPRKIGSYADPLRNHMWECVLDCRYAYGATGTILGLSDPAKPVKVGDWTATRKPEAFHAIEEVAPGLVMTGSNPMLLLDARSDPANPTLLRELALTTARPPKPYLIIGGNPTTVPARLAWPNQTQSRHLLVTMESPFSGDCAEHSGGILSFDTKGWKKKRGFKGFIRIDEYKMTDNGMPNEGSAPVNFFGCTAYGLDVTPSYATNGLVATAWFEHGTRVLRVGADGRFTEVGGFVAHAGNAARPVWRTDDVLYVVDFERGIDVLRVTA